MSVSRVAAQIEMGVNSNEFNYQVNTMEASMEAMEDSFRNVAGATTDASRSLQSHTGQYDRLETVLASAVLRLDEMSVQMSGLFQAQTRLAKGRKDLQSAFDRDLTMKVGSILDPADAQTSGELENKLGKSQRLLQEIRWSYQEVTKEQELEVEQLNRKLTLQNQLKQLERNAVGTTEDEQLRISEQQLAIEREIKSIQTDKASVAAYAERLNTLRESGHATEKRILETARQIVATRRAEIAEMQRVSGMLDQNQGIRDSEMGSRSSYESRISPELERNSAQLAQQFTAVNLQIATAQQRMDKLVALERQMIVEKKDTTLINDRITRSQKELNDLRSQGLTLQSASKQKAMEEAAAVEQAMQAQLRKNQELSSALDRNQQMRDRSNENRLNFGTTLSPEQSFSAGELDSQFQSVANSIRQSEQELQSLLALEREMLSNGQNTLLINNEIKRVDQEITENRSRAVKLHQDAATQRRQETEAAQQLRAAEQKITDTLEQQVAARRQQFADTERSRREVNRPEQNRSTEDLNTFDERLSRQEQSNQAKILDTLRRQAAVKKQSAALEAQLTNATDDRFTIEKRLQASRKQEAGLTDNLTSLDERRNAISERRKRIQTEISRNRRDEGQAVSKIVNLMNTLGDRSSIGLAIEQQLATNRREFNRMLERSITLGAIELDQAQQLRDRFEEINTEDNARRQLSAVGGTNKAGFALQQASYGLEDFAVQIERGFIPAISGAANNINTLLGAIGPPWVMALSTATIAGLQFGKALGFWGTAAEEAADPLDNVKSQVRSLSEEIDRVNANADIMINIDISPDLGAIDSQIDSVLDNIRKASAKQQELVAEIAGERAQATLDELDGWGVYVSNLIDEAGSKAAIAFEGVDDTDRGRRLDAQADLRLQAEQELERLGANRTDRERELISLNQQMLAASGQLTTGLQKQNQLSSELASNLEGDGSGLMASEESRSLLDLQLQSNRLRKQEESLAERIVELSADLVIENKNTLSLTETQEEKTARIVALTEGLAQAQAESNRLVQQRNELDELGRKRMEESVDAQQTLNDLIREQKALQYEVDGIRMEAADQIKTAMEAIATVRLIDPQQANELQRQLMEARSAAFRSQRTDINESLIPADAFDEFRDYSDTLMQLDRSRELAAERLATGRFDEGELLAKIAGTEQEILHFEEKRIAALQKLEGSQKSIDQLIRGRYDSLNKELAVERERLKVAETLQDSVRAGVLTQAEANLRQQDYQNAVASAERLKDIDLERNMLKENSARIERSLSETAASPELQAVTRTSQAAASAISRAMREGQERSDQKPVVAELVKVAEKMDLLIEEARQIKEQEPVGSYPD